MELINISNLDLDFLKIKFIKKPFNYIIIDNFLVEEFAEKILKEFPDISNDWVDARGLHTQNKWTQPIVDKGLAETLYEEIHSEEFRSFLSKLTGVDNLLADESLNGAGFHQTTDGGFLDVHVDFNRHHDDSTLDRRLNILIYFNKDWHEDNGGYLELWDMNVKERIEAVAPKFNRCVIFETNEVSYHGHPVPVKLKGGGSRKSISSYYYTRGRSDVQAETHNTLYVNTQAGRGKLKIMANGVRHFIRKVAKKLRNK